jgi:hypothetical protein
MTTLREAAQQALEALDWIGCSPEGYDQMCADRDRAQEALRDALAKEEQEQDQEPVAWMTHTLVATTLLPLFHANRKAALNWQTQPTPLYTHPPRHDIEKAYESACKIIDELDKKVTELETVNAELLEALKQALEECMWPNERLSDVYEKARAAITKAEEQK